MTNTRITDAEIMEIRYPILLSNFGLRPGSGGQGQYSGGAGVIREYVFRQAMTLCILSERRVFQPYGLQGGSPGARGLNLLTNSREKGLQSRLPSKSSVQVQAGDIFCLYTPGGGGYGSTLGSSHALETREMEQVKEKYEKLLSLDPSTRGAFQDMETLLQN